GGGGVAAAALGDDDAALHPLAEGLELGERVVQLREVEALELGVRRQSDGDAHEREILELVTAVAHAHEALLSVLFLVQLGALPLEGFLYTLRPRFAALGRTQDDEVVAADVADEVVLVAVLVDDLDQRLGDARDGDVSAGEAVAVVVGLEVIDVEDHLRERTALVEPALALGQDA